MKRNDLLVLLCVLAIGAALWLASGRGSRGGDAEMYMRVEMPDAEAQLIPLSEERDIELVQPDGSRNVVHISKDGFYMAEASCRNRDCVKQGEVTRENRDSRPLYDKVICLPNRVTLTLVDSAEESAETLELTP